jgi:hypothetical protein
MESVVIDIEPIELPAVELPLKQLRLVLAWAELHREALMEETAAKWKPSF